MIHARKDYNRIQDPALTDPSLLGEGSTPFGEDEPVFLLRAKDEFFVPMLEHYQQLLQHTHPIREQAEPMAWAIADHIETAHYWQLANGSRLPDMPTAD